MYRDRPLLDRKGDSTVIKILLAIFLTISLGWLIREAYVYWMVDQTSLHSIHSREPGRSLPH